jgi:hypothetical protein
MKALAKQHVEIQKERRYEERFHWEIERDAV